MTSARSPRSTAALAALIAGLARLWALTWRWSSAGKAPVDAALAEGPVVFAFWHGDQLPLALAHADQGVVGMASLSDDGALLAAVIDRLGFGVVRGSRSRGAVAAVLASRRALLSEGRSVALAVDGPRGPRHVAAGGAATLARAAGRPIACVRARCSPALRLNSWDNFCIPLPFARIQLSYSLIPLRPDEGVEAYTATVQRTLLAAEPRAAAEPESQPESQREGRGVRAAS